MRYRVLIPLFVVAFILQLTLINLIAVNGIVPSLLLCLVLIITLIYENEHRSIACGMVAGILLDIVTGKYLGIYALTFFLLGALTVLYKHYFNFESKISIVPLGILGTILYQVIPCTILAILGVSVSVVKILLFLPIAIILNLAVMFILYILMIKRATARPVRSRYERYEIL